MQKKSKISSIFGIGSLVLWYFVGASKQLEEIYPLKGEAHQSRRVDKLIKLWTKDGKEKWLLIHVEVQGYRDKELSKRIFQYFYRILDSYKQEYPRDGALGSFIKGALTTFGLRYAPSAFSHFVGHLFRSTKKL